VRDGLTAVMPPCCRGRLTYYTEPPETYTRSSHVSAEIVSEMSLAFDISSLLSAEDKALQGTVDVAVVLFVRRCYRVLKSLLTFHQTNVV